MKTELYVSEKKQIEIPNGCYGSTTNAVKVTDDMLVKVAIHDDLVMIQSHSANLLSTYDAENIKLMKPIFEDEFDAVYIKALERTSDRIK